MRLRFDRRDFLKTTAAAGAGYWLTATATSAARAADKPNEKIQFASIGVGGKGSSDCDHAGALGVMVALCDCDEKPLNAKKAKFSSAETFFDYRKMFEKLGKQIDAVTVSTPDHTHAPASIMAMKLKKHVYTQKPLTHSVWEAREMRRVAKEMGVCTQMGNQGTAENGLRRAVELVQAGVLGKVTEVHVWTNRPIWPQAPSVMARPKDTPEVPPNVHWDEFLGPAPFRPYHKAYHPFAWRGWWDFGTGALGDMACHTANMAYMACQLGLPTSVEAEAGDVNPETCPSYAHGIMQFPERNGLPPVTFHWYEGKKNGKKMLPPEELLSKLLRTGEKLADSGSIIVGDKAILFSPNDYGAQYRITPEVDTKGVSETLPRNGKGDMGMKQEWVQAIRENKPSIAMSNFEYAASLTEAILLPNVAIRVGKKFEYDGNTGQAKNCPEAAQYIKREYRKGWEV